GLVVASPDAKDPHWDESAQNFIEGLILHVASSPHYQRRRTLNAVRRLIMLSLAPAPEGSDWDYEVHEEMMETAHRLSNSLETAAVGQAIEAAARAFYDRSGDEQA